MFKQLLKYYSKGHAVSNKAYNYSQQKEDARINSILPRFSWVVTKIPLEESRLEIRHNVVRRR